jgi:thiamine biosynthesis lipoprotein
MATHFELLIDSDDSSYAASAAQAAWNDLDKLENELSRFREGSDIWRIGGLPIGTSIPIGFAALDCLALAEDVKVASGGAFDIAIGPLYKLWCAPDGTLRNPSEEAITDALSRCRQTAIELDPENYRLTARSEQPQLDLGGIGKGYALDQMAALFREWSLENVLLNAGSSTVLAIGHPGGDPEGWTVRAGKEYSQSIKLRDRALSGSGFAEKGSHIIDPRNGRPVSMEADTRWAMAPNAALSDALSTAFIVLSPDEIQTLCSTQGGEIEAILC